MAKLTALVLALLAVWLIWRGAKKGRDSVGGKSSRDAETMVACARCKLNFPRSEAIISPEGLFFCCEEHRLMGGQ